MVRFGILGLGKIATKFAADLQLVEGAELAAVGSRTLEKAKQFSQKFNATRYYDSYHSVLTDPKVDVIYIATPHHLHYENSIKCLNAGKSVICEKPLSMNLAQVKEMIALAREKQLFFMEALWTRFIPATIQVKKLIANDEIGEVKMLRADFGFKVPKEKPGRLTDPKMGGGTLLDIGIYNIFISQFLLGKPNNISATGQLYNATDRQCAITLAYDDALAVLTSSFESDVPVVATIHGSLGTITMHHPYHQCSKITISKPHESDRIVDLSIRGAGYCYEIEEVRDCIKNNQIESTKMSWNDSTMLMEAMEQVMHQIGLTYDS
jgi:predicted dehydrogenase